MQGKAEPEKKLKQTNKKYPHFKVAVEFFYSDIIIWPTAKNLPREINSCITANSVSSDLFVHRQLQEKQLNHSRGQKLALSPKFRRVRQTF